MLGEAECRAILESALAQSESETEALLIAKDTQLTRFANNAIHQNVAESNATLFVRVVVGKRLGSATTNDLSEAGIEQTVAAARAFAQAAPEVSDFSGLPRTSAPAAAPAWDEATAACPPETRAQAAGVVCRRAAEAGLNASGAFRTGTREWAVLNSHGLRAYHAGTLADFLTTVMGDDAAGRAQISGWRVADLDTEAVGQEALGKAARGARPRALPPGEYPVVVDPYVTFDILHNLATSGMSAQIVQEGQSWMNGRIGQQVFSPAVSIWDDGRDPGGVPLPFDVEGVARQRLDIARAGVLGGPAHDTQTAARAGVTSTGHAAAPDNRRWRTGPVPVNLFLGAGEAALDEMIAGIDKGLYVSTFWYTRLVHPRDSVFTGMTRDGLFWIERGELAYPVKNLRFTQAYVDALANVEAVGRDTRLLMDPYGYATRVPALKIGSWRFTGATA